MSDTPAWTPRDLAQLWLEAPVVVRYEIAATIGVPLRHPTSEGMQIHFLSRAREQGKLEEVWRLLNEEKSHRPQ